MAIRPTGLMAMTEVILQLTGQGDLSGPLREAAKLPRDLAKSPYSHVLWDPVKSSMIAKGGPLARRLMLFVLRPKQEKDPERLRLDYARALGLPDDPGVRLPVLQ